MGSTTYYLSSIPVKELVMVVRPASEALPDWDEMSIEDRFQRDINLKRLHDEVVPYLASHPDRFFGSVIVLIDGEVSFESLMDFNVTIPKAYEGPLEKFGFLTVAGGNWIALDGQHRLVALREILMGKYDGQIQPGIANDDVSVIFIEHENIQKTRRIFNKVNRYARPTSRADNLILSEDDGYAIISRKLFTDKNGAWKSLDPNADEIVNWKNNTLSGRSLQLTTISALSIMVKDICEANGIVLDEKSLGGVLPEKRLIDAGFAVCQEWFDALFRAFAELDSARRDVSVLPRNRELDATFAFLFKPAGQIALFRAARRAKENIGTAFDIDKFVKQAARLDWRVDSQLWDGIIVLGGMRIMAKQSNYEDAALMILWQVYGNQEILSDELLLKIYERWALAHAQDNVKIPAPL
jgi:DNA sulfur modification protein DndB